MNYVNSYFMAIIYPFHDIRGSKWGHHPRSTRAVKEF
jgi:hypothetical protein